MCQYRANDDSDKEMPFAKDREREFIQGDIVLLQTHSDNTAIVEQKIHQIYKNKNLVSII